MADKGWPEQISLTDLLIFVYIDVVWLHDIFYFFKEISKIKFFYLVSETYEWDSKF